MKQNIKLLRLTKVKSLNNLCPRLSVFIQLLINYKKKKNEEGNVSDLVNECPTEITLYTNVAK